MGRKMGDAKKAEELSNYMTLQSRLRCFQRHKEFLTSLHKKKKMPFLAELDEALFKGNLRNKIDPNAWAKVTKIMKDKKVSKEKIDKMYNAITNSRGAFVELLDFIKRGSSHQDQVKTNVKELEEIMGDRVKQYHW